MKVDCWPCQLKETVLVFFTKRIKEIASLHLPGNVLICSINETTLTPAILESHVIRHAVIYCRS